MEERTLNLNRERVAAAAAAANEAQFLHVWRMTSEFWQHGDRLKHFSRDARARVKRRQA